MRVSDLPGVRSRRAGVPGFTLPEVLMALFIMMLLFGGIITTYIQASYRAEWSGFSLAAQAAAIQQLEAAKSAVWDPTGTTLKDEISQLTNATSVLLDLPVTGTNTVYATNYPTIRLIQNGSYSNYLVRIDTVWPFRWRNQTVYFTNTVACYYAPD